MFPSSLHAILAVVGLPFARVKRERAPAVCIVMSHALGDVGAIVARLCDVVVCE